ncbi:hypothetical protein JNM05_01280 [bacterium]|nr:hypothetical protein [bacterium]
MYKRWFTAAAIIALLQGGCKENDTKEPYYGDYCDTSTCFVQGNNWKMAVSTNGILGYDQPDIDHDMNNAGGIFKSYSTIFASGLFVGATKNGIPSVTMARFSSEFSQGRIVNSSPAAIQNLTYSDNMLDVVYIVDQSRNGYSWDHWPIWAGAPETGGQPQVLSAEDSWVVFHDADSAGHAADESTEVNPILGLEVQQSTYSFTGATLEDAVFVRWRITNKSNINYTDLHVGLWCDADVINASDDLAGSDTSRNMIYVYNKMDIVSQNISVGLIPLYTSDGGLTVTPAAMIEYLKSVDESRPDNEQFNLMKGLNGNGDVRSNAALNRPTFDFPGDPVLNTGIVDTTALDKRILVSVGPAVLNSGQTKEFVFAIIGSQGSDRLNSIVNLRSTADALRQVFVSQIAAQIGL